MTAFLTTLDARRRTLLLAGGCALLLAILFALLLAPQLRAYRSAEAARTALPPLPVDSAVLEATLRERGERIEALGKEVHGDMAGLPAREVEAFVVDRLQSLAWKHDVTLQAVRPMQGETIDTFQELLFRLELTGDYFDLYRWLGDLRRDLGFIVIKEYRMLPAGAGQPEQLLRVQLTVASYQREAV